MTSSALNSNRLVVIGAGPKGLAIAAKRKVLAELGWSVPRLVIVDKGGVAANWRGDAGFTDGTPILGTPPTKDVGYPYASTCWDALNQSVDKAMLAFSWQYYKIVHDEYANWIDRGQPSPTHREWSSYLHWVAAQLDLDLVEANVSRIAVIDGKWRISCKKDEQPQSTDDNIEGDGLVITGPGTPMMIAGQPLYHHRIMNGSDFWLRKSTFQGVTKPQVNICVIGTGETAAAIVVALLDMLPKEQAQPLITVISAYGMLFSRGESFRENSLFSDPGEWGGLTEQHRREFVRRTDRGVFSLQALQRIDLADNVRVIPGHAVRIGAEDLQVFVRVSYGDNPNNYTIDDYDYVIVATRFDQLWFTELLDIHTHSLLLDATGGNASASITSEAIERTIGRDLAIGRLEPRLHLPMHAGFAQGPGFPNLSSLGLLSDRILESYCSYST